MRATTEAGRLLERTLELDFDCERFRVGWGEITCEEAGALKILKQERDKWQREDSKERQQEMERQRLASNAQAKANQGGGI